MGLPDCRVASSRLPVWVIHLVSADKILRICPTFEQHISSTLSGATTERGSGGPEVAGSRPAAARFYFFSTDEIWTNQRRKNKKQGRDRRKTMIAIKGGV